MYLRILALGSPFEHSPFCWPHCRSGLEEFYDARSRRASILSSGGSSACEQRGWQGNQGACVLIVAAPVLPCNCG